MPLRLPWYSACWRAGINERSEWENSGHSPAGGRAPALSQKNARTGRRSHAILSPHRAHQGAAISEIRGTKSRQEDGAESIPALSHLNPFFPASMRRPRRVTERPEPNRGETVLGRGSPSSGARARPLEPWKRQRWRAGRKRPGTEEPLLSSLSSISSVSRLTESGAPKTPCPRRKRDREEGERRPAH